MSHAVRQQVGLGTMLSLVVGSIIGAGIFVLPSSLAPLGWNAPIGWLVSSSGTLCLAFTLAVLSRGGKGVQAHIQEAFGPTAGFVAAWSFWCGCWSSIAIMALAAAAALSRVIPELGNSTISTSVAIGFIVILTGINALGIRSAGRMQIVTTLIKIVPLIAVVVILVLRNGRGEQAQPFAPTPLSFESIATATTLTLFALSGFEFATTPVGKIRDPNRTIPLAMMLGTFMVALLYVVSSTSVLALLSPASAAASPAPYADALAIEWGDVAVSVAATCIAVSAFGCLNGNILGGGELAYAMALRKDLPPVLERTRPDGTPVYAQLAASALGIGLILLASNRGGENVFTFIILVTTVGQLVMYALSIIASFATVRRALARGVILMAGAFTLFAFYGAGLEANAWGLLLVVSGLIVRAGTRIAMRSRTLAIAA